MQKLKLTLGKYFKMPSKELMLIYGISFALLIIVFSVLYFTVGRSLTAFVTDQKSFQIWLESYKNMSGVIFVFIRTFQTVIKIIPAEPLEIASGYVFGTWGGLALCSLGSFLGSLIIVLLSKLIGAKFISQFVNEEQFRRLSVINNRKNQRLFLLVFYLIPGTPKDLLTYVAGSLNVNLVEFFLITTIARVPSIITSTICGEQLEQKNFIVAAAVFITTAVVSLICTVIYKKSQNKRHCEH
ncbi:MAG: VTT domain-containing protein [Clostridiales bacterium]|nr:VTT domain-containing protein [Clostridiales bacterium]